MLQGASKIFRVFRGLIADPEDPGVQRQRVPARKSALLGIHPTDTAINPLILEDSELNHARALPHSCGTDERQTIDGIWNLPSAGNQALHRVIEFFPVIRSITFPHRIRYASHDFRAHSMTDERLKNVVPLEFRS